MRSTSSLIVFALSVGICLGGPTKNLDAAPAENEVGAQRSSPVVDNAETPLPTVKNVEDLTLIHSPVKDPPHFTHSKDEDNFGIVSGYAEGKFHNEEFGYAGKGAATGIAGGLVNDKGVTGGGAGHAAGIAGVDTKPFKGFLSVSTNSQATFNTYGEKAVPFTKEEETPEEEVKVEPVPVAGASSGTTVNKNSEASAEKSPILPLIPTVSGTIGSLFKPILPLTPPSLIHTLTGGLLSPKPIFGLKDTEEVENEAEVEAAGPAAAEAEEESGFYNFIRPLTPSGIAHSVSTILKPLTTLAGQAQGSITLTGGASLTPEAPPPPKPVTHHKPTPVKPPACHANHPDEGKLKECKAACKKNGKAGGSITGGCCTCACPAPGVPDGHLCCSGSDKACDSHCKRNSFHNYVGGSCNAKTHNCECRCNPWEPCWTREVEILEHHEHSLQVDEEETEEEKKV